jgi:hypothetical protein
MTGERWGCTRVGGPSQPGIPATSTDPDREENWALTTAQFGGWPVSTRVTDWCRHRAGARTGSWQRPCTCFQPGGVSPRHTDKENV